LKIFFVPSKKNGGLQSDFAWPPVDDGLALFDVATGAGGGGRVNTGARATGGGGGDQW
jgi:hypothetical protein